MNVRRLHPILHRFMAPAGEHGSDAGGGGGGGEDRGDNHVPSDDDVTDVEIKDPKNDAADKAAADKAAADKAEADAEAARIAAEEEDDLDEGGDKKDPKGDDKKDPKKPDSRMPLARHKAILAKEREQRETLERQLAAFQKGTQVANVNDAITKAEDKVLKLDGEYAQLIADGKTKEAADKMREIRGIERDIAASKVEMASAAASARAIEKARYDIVVERLEAAYPELNPDGDDFNEEQAQDVMDLAAVYRGKGNTPAEAIQKAAQKLLKVAGKEQERATTVAPRVDAAKAEKDAAAERRREQVQKNLDTNRKQPPSTKNVGADHDKAGGSLDAKTVMRMSQDAFAKLTEEDLSRMRGDTLA